MAKPQRPLYAQPIHERPSLGVRQLILGLIWAVVFNIGCLMTHGSQLVFLVPLRLLIVFVPIPFLKHLHEAGVRWTKKTFGELSVLMCQWFAPTRMVVTFEGENIKEDDVVIRDSDGRVLKLNLPDKLVIIANHQIYADWWYIWCLIYACNMHKDVLITLKASLKWIPIVGWGMQIYHFIFLARSWASDRVVISEQLSKLAVRTRMHATSLSFMMFPEGTLVSKLTRPVSRRFAEKKGIEDMRNMLLPHSTGLHHCLYSLSPQIPDLHLLDVTIAYEGIPPQGYGQSYYTLRSIFFNGVSPPRIHMHLRLYVASKDIPLGDTPSGSSHTLATNEGLRIDPRTSSGYASQAKCEKITNPTEQEADLFDQWLRKLWREKDSLIDRYHATGTFADSSKASVRDSGHYIDSASLKDSLNVHSSGDLEIPVELRSKWEIPEAFAYFAPLLTCWAIWRCVV